MENLGEIKIQAATREGVLAGLALLDPAKVDVSIINITHKPNNPGFYGEYEATIEFDCGEPEGELATDDCKCGVCAIQKELFGDKNHD